jgi:hypothetical protein
MSPCFGWSFYIPLDTHRYCVDGWMTSNGICTAPGNGFLDSSAPADCTGTGTMFQYFLGGSTRYTYDFGRYALA